VARLKDEDVVRAAGVVVWRRRKGRLEVLLVHRPRYDDWSFAKGKCDAGESDKQCALRELEEETNQRVQLGRELDSSRYVDGRGRPKLVRYWEAELDKERSFTPNAEVDELRWVAADEAANLLTYDRDVEVLESFSQALGRSPAS
jgi:8-oxo-dGTP diphosphatase